jgi:hypothetical protein
MPAGNTDFEWLGIGFRCNTPDERSKGIEFFKGVFKFNGNEAIINNGKLEFEGEGQEKLHSLLEYLAINNLISPFTNFDQVKEELKKTLLTALNSSLGRLDGFRPTGSSLDIGNLPDFEIPEGILLSTIVSIRRPITAIFKFDPERQAVEAVSAAAEATAAEAEATAATAALVPVEEAVRAIKALAVERAKVIARIYESPVEYLKGSTTMIGLQERHFAIGENWPKKKDLSLKDACIAVVKHVFKTEEQKKIINKIQVCIADLEKLEEDEGKARQRVVGPASQLSTKRRAYTESLDGFILFLPWRMLKGLFFSVLIAAAYESIKISPIFNIGVIGLGVVGMIFLLKETILSSCALWEGRRELVEVENAKNAAEKMLETTTESIKSKESELKELEGKLKAEYKPITLSLELNRNEKWHNLIRQLGLKEIGAAGEWKQFQTDPLVNIAISPFINGNAIITIGSNASNDMFNALENLAVAMGEICKDNACSESFAQSFA